MHATSAMILTFIWALLALLVIVAGVRHLLRMRALRRRRAASLGDDAIRQIERTGYLPPRDTDDAPPTGGDPGTAEEAAWAEEWDEPEEYER